MMKFYNIPKGESIFEKGTKPKLEYLSSCYLDCEGHARSMHAHNEVLEIVFVYKGEGIQNVDSHAFRTYPGDILIHNEGVLHEEKSAISDGLYVYGCGISNLHIKGMKPGQLAATPSEIRVPTGEYHNKILGILEIIESLVKEGTPEAEEIADNLIAAVVTLTYSLIKKQAQTVTDTADRSAVVHAIKDYIDEHFTENFTLVELGKRFGISPYYASHLFKDATGWSPMQYRQQRRIGEAQSLLTHTPYSITFVAAAVGYDNPNQFTQRFTKAVGVSPKKFRERSVVKKPESKKAKENKN